MSVTLPSDLVMDVMRNADPARREAATARLKAVSGSSVQDAMFASVADTIAPAGRPAAKESPSSGFDSRGTPASQADSPYRGFERLVLRNLFETLLPESESGAFGSGPSAGIWRSMAADEMAGVYADAGGVGIADMLQKGNGEPLARQAQWPYFSVTQINGFKG